MKKCAFCSEDAKCSAPCDCGPLCRCDRIIEGIKDWAAGNSTESQQRRALKYIRNHPEI